MTTARTGHSYLDADSGVTLDVWFPPDVVEPKRACLAETVGLTTGIRVEVELGDVDRPPTTAADVYHRLHLLSRCRARPNEVNLDGMFGLLTNVAWTSAGPVLPERLDELRSRVADHDHHLQVPSIDKIPRMTDYVSPAEVRIADADRVRLGAHLAPGTTVMHEGFVNFNAGTLGPAMVEGRITPGVTVGANSDVGAGSSIMGTLSGGGTSVNSIGENSLLGANGGIGVSLGDRCIVEAGLYVTAGTKVRLVDGSVVQARELSGRSDLMYRRNSQTGAVEAVPSASSNWGGLNTDLHGN
ncbi:MAG: DapH/DapD/GlmU-related protein [Acidimicrobiales bacterium]